MALASEARAGYLPCMIVTRASRMNNAHRPAVTRRLRVAATAVALVLAMAACTSGDEGNDTPARDASQALELNVMEFNIEYGGNNVDASVIDAIQAAEADVVAIEEAYGKMPRLAAELGWPYYDAGLQLVSRFPLLAPPESEGLYTFVAVRPGRVVAVGNVHLPSTRYGPFQIERNDAKPEEVMEIERNLRLPALEPTLDAVSTLASQGMPVFLAGDFNSPSHLDWTQETVGLRDHVRFPLDWPVSMAVEQAGLHDSYREMHPDPVADEGLTWPAARRGKGYNPARNGAAADRIDFVYAGGPATTTGSVLVGEPGGAGVDIEIPQWPTDHRATVSTFDVTPADPPAFVAVEQRLVEVGDDARVTYHAPDGNAGRVVVVPEGEAPGTGDVAEQPAEGAKTDGTRAFSTAGWEPGSYEAVLLSSSGEELARIPFWVQGVGVGPEIDTVQPTYEEGRPIDVEWHAAPGNRFDWIGIYKRGADPKVAYYIMWNYTEAAVDGSATFDDDAHGPWPLKPGDYSVYLLQDDSYKLLAGGDFTVRG
jgi:endonuclease/exonuclease/phosphatase family metal-dependent hydrolase